MNKTVTNRYHSFDKTWHTATFLMSTKLRLLTNHPYTGQKYELIESNRVASLGYSRQSQRVSLVKCHNHQLRTVTRPIYALAYQKGETTELVVTHRNYLFLFVLLVAPAAVPAAAAAPAPATALPLAALPALASKTVS
jgi:hypothetical protein